MSKQQRRKGNAKNASSSAAHGYLSQAGASFVGLTPEMNIFTELKVSSYNEALACPEIDVETRIVMKKLTKKDCLTREKGLKELLELVNNENTTVDTCYERFVGLAPQLTTDGSPAVRMLTMKLILQFLLKLKKAASSGLKKIIPLVIFAKSDVTNGVAAAAATVLRDGFGADKKRTLTEVFGPTAFEMAAAIAQGDHELALPTDYDGSEDSASRKSRLETQSLNVFISFIKEFGNEWPIWQSFALPLFQNAEYVKKVLTGNRDTLKVQLLTICYRLPNCAQVMLGVPSVVPYIQNTLDVQTFSPECATAWEGLVLLIPDEKFQTKVSLVKAIVPRILNVVRKKGIHWRVLKHYLLPSVVVLLQELKGGPDGDLKTIAAILDSFTDNLPWPAEVSMNAIHCWFHTFADFVRWSLTGDRINLDILKTIVPLTIKMSEQAMLFNTLESAECIADLISWMVENKIGNELETRRLCQLVESKIIEIGGEKSRFLADCLTKSGRFEELSFIHATLLTKPDLFDFKVLRNLAKSEPDYFKTTIAKIADFSFLENTLQFDASQTEDVVELILRILDSGDCQKTLEIRIRNDHVGRALLLSTNENFWETRLRTTDESVLGEMIEYWHETRNGKANAIAVNFLKKMGVELDIKEAAENVDFLISSLSTLDSNGDKNELVNKLFVALFESEEEPKNEHFRLLADNLNENFDTHTFLDKLFSDDSFMETERILEVAERFDKLMELCDENSRKVLVENSLISEHDADEIGQRTHYLELDVLTYSQNSTLLTDSFTRPSEIVEMSTTISRVKTIGRTTLFNLASQYHARTQQIVGWQVSRIIDSVRQRYCLTPLDEELRSLKEEIEKRLVHVEIEDNIHRNKAPNFLAHSSKWNCDQEKAFYRRNCEGWNEKNKMDTVFFESDSPLNYMEHIFEASQSENSFPLFQFDQTSQYEWLANLKFAKRFLQCGGNIFATDNFELRDFALCGMVTVLDQATDTISSDPNAFEQNPRLEALTALYTELFVILDETANGDTYPEQSVEEWKEFYSPTMRTYFIRLSRAVRKDQQPTPWIRSLLKVLLSSIRTFPDDLRDEETATREFVPELSQFAYPSFQESCISHAFSLFSSRVEHVQLVGYAIAKLLMPIMFRTENAAALKTDDEAEVSVPEKRRKLCLPVMIEKTYPRNESQPHTAVLLLDLALTPLEKADESFGQEQRVSYCDDIDQFIKHALNALLLEQPFDFRHVPIACRIPKNEERDYYLCSDLSASPVFFDKFACRVLFKSITLLPAAVRLFHKNMRACFMPMFNEAVTKYASRLLIEQELFKVRDAKFTGGEMKVRTVPVTGEIIAEYVVEETKMKLTIGLPVDYPLSVPTMTLDKAIVKSDRAKKWLLQLNAYLFHQNGAILEGIEMWKRNVDKGVEGVEDCTICMMTVHQTTHQLPKVKCKQCKNKFHSNCLYKWFESSNQSTCPLCRNNFT